MVETIFQSPKFPIDINTICYISDITDTGMFADTSIPNTVISFKQTPGEVNKISAFLYNLNDLENPTSLPIKIDKSEITNITSYTHQRAFYFTDSLLLFNIDGTIDVIGQDNVKVTFTPEVDITESYPIVVDSRVFIFDTVGRFIVIFNMDSKEFSYDLLEANITNPLIAYYDNILYILNKTSTGIDKTIYRFNVNQSRWIGSLTISNDILTSMGTILTPIYEDSEKIFSFYSSKDSLFFVGLDPNTGESIGINFKIPYLSFSTIPRAPIVTLSLKYPTEMTNSPGVSFISTVTPRIGFGVDDKIDVFRLNDSVMIDNLYIDSYTHMIIEDTKQYLLSEGYFDSKIYLIRDIAKFKEEDRSYMKLRSGFLVRNIINYDYIEVDGFDEYTNDLYDIQFSTTSGDYYIECKPKDMTNYTKFISMGENITITDLVSKYSNSSPYGVLLISVE